MVVDANTVKQSVISVINLQPNGLPADELNDDYKKIMGSDIPFRAMGYNSLLKFIEEELKERVRLERHAETSEVYLFPIASGHSGHIVNLIMGEPADKNNRRKRVPILTSSKNTNDAGGQQCEQQVLQTSQSRSQPTHYLRGNNQNWAQQMSKTRENQLKIIKNYEQFGGHKELSLNDVDDREHIGRANKQESKSCFKRNQSYYSSKMQTGRFQEQQQPNRSKTPTSSSKANDSTETRNENISSLKKQYQTGDGSDNRRYDTRNNGKMSGNDRSTTPNLDRLETLDADYGWEDVLRDIDDLALSIVDERRNIDTNFSPHEFLESCLDDKRQESFSCASAIFSHIDKISFSLNKNDAIQMTHVWTELSIDDRFECILTEINNPLKFWVQRKEDKNVFATLLKQMSQFYNRHGTKLELWDDDLDEHELFACCWEDKRWYRVRAESVRAKEDKVQVRFVDFGSRMDVKIEQLRRLPSEFMKVPILAICCALGNIYPTLLGRFTANSAEHIIKLTENKDLIAKVLNIDRSKPKIMVALQIKESSMDVSENLVQNNHAKFRLQM